MTQSFRCKDTQGLFEGKRAKRVRAIADVAERKLHSWMPRAGQYSVRINDQWRVCLNWTETGPIDVEIVDYHRKTIMKRSINRMRAVHPGEVLQKDYLAPLGLSVNALALALGVAATRIHEIVKERRGVTADTATRLARYFGGDAASWLALQSSYDLKTLPTRKEIERHVSSRKNVAA